MKEIVVSVIIPNYNHSAYIKERIESILRQTYESYELILLDDCSTDDSRNIILQYKNNPHVSQIVFNEENSGSPFKQWDKGIKLARGKYIWIAESDDYAHPDFLKSTVAILDNNLDVVIVYTGSQMIDSESRFMSLDWDKFDAATPLYNKYNSYYFLSRKMLWNTSIYNASMVLFRKECYDKVDKGYKSFNYCGDWYFWIDICRQGGVVSFNQKLNYFRQHENKVSPKAEKDGLYFIEGGRIMKRMISLLHLSKYQESIIIGRTLKRLYKLTKKNKLLKQEVLKKVSLLSNSNYFYILIYELDKIFNFSRLHSR